MIVALLAAVGCAAPPAPEPAPKEDPAVDTITFEGIVTSYKPDAMRDETEDSFAVYDAAEVRVTAPPEHAGKALVFYLDTPVAADAPWRAAGGAVCFSLRPDDLRPGRQLFGGAAKGLRRC
ncbi:MAG: hypothetical protein ABMA64_23050 [Myxococcota bacterium]